MKKVFLILIALMFILSSAYAETFRQGGERITFNQTTSVTKIADYTVTTSDSLINVTASSVDLVITLPARSSLGSGGRVFKILKTDATSWVITVTPATGDTIGGESTRVLVAQNDYMVISSASGSKTDWKVDFESPYLVEDYEAGTVTVNAPYGGLRATETVTVTATLTRADCGKTIFLNHGSTAIILTLPLPTDGCYFKFQVMLAFSDQHEVRTSGTTNIIQGTMHSNDADVACADEDSLEFLDNGETVGDYIAILSNGVSWLIQDTYADAAGLACTT